MRCGRCRAELDIQGPGEFVCPACGTRNVARGGNASDPLAAGMTGSGLTVPGGAPAPRPPATQPPSDVRWGACPSCGYRFAMGEVDEVTCPNCRAQLVRDETGVLVLSAS